MSTPALSRSNSEENLSKLETSLQKLGSPTDDFSTDEREWLRDYTALSGRIRMALFQTAIWEDATRRLQLQKDAKNYEVSLVNLMKRSPFQSGRSKLYAEECEQMLKRVNIALNPGTNSVPRSEAIPEHRGPPLGIWGPGMKR